MFESQICHLWRSEARLGLQYVPLFERLEVKCLAREKGGGGLEFLCLFDARTNTTPFDARTPLCDTCTPP